MELNTEVLSLDQYPEGWMVETLSKGTTRSQLFDYVVVSSGLFTKGSFYPVFPGQSEFKGEIHFGPFIDDLNSLRDKDVVIVG